MEDMEGVTEIEMVDMEEIRDMVIEVRVDMDTETQIKVDMGIEMQDTETETRAIGEDRVKDIKEEVIIEEIEKEEVD